MIDTTAITDFDTAKLFVFICLHEMWLYEYHVMRTLTCHIRVHQCGVLSQLCNYNILKGYGFKVG